MNFAGITHFFILVITVAALSISEYLWFLYLKGILSE